MAVPHKLSIIRPRLGQAAALLRRHVTLVSGVLLLVFALVIRLHNLGAQSLWLDEGGTWAEVAGRTGKGWVALIGELWSSTAAYPLYHLLLKIWVSLAGDSEWALRFPSALAGALAVLPLFLALDHRPPTTDHPFDPSASRFLSLSKGRAGFAQGRRPPTTGPNDTVTRRQGDKVMESEEAITSSPLHPFTPSGSSVVSRQSSVVALLLAVSPFAIWHAQDAKVYSLLLLVIALLLWAFLRALRRGGARAWLLVLALALLSVFVHRLALLALAGLALAYLIIWPNAENKEQKTKNKEPRTENQEPRTENPTHHVSRFTFHVSRLGFALLTLALAAGSVIGTILAVRNEIRGSGHIAAGPFQGLWLSVLHFSVERGNIAELGLPAVVWALPCIVLLLWGLVLLARDARRGDHGATTILCALIVPLALLAAALAFVPIYEARYAIVAFPAWLLALAYPFRPRSPGEDRELKIEGSTVVTPPSRSSILHPLPSILLAALLLVNALILFQPRHGLFSGEPVKEQWRDAIADLARRAHPDDLLILHPYYVQPLWDYYAPRVTPDPLPQPTSFTGFKEGFILEQTAPEQVRERFRREYEPVYRHDARGKKRALLLIAPDHARTIDPPKTLAELIAETPLGQAPPTEEDRYGWLGLRFQYSAEQGTWPCGGAKFVGVEVMCQSYPEFFGLTGAAAIPQPAIPLEATFGGELRLRGYSLDLLGGVARPGGALPITLYWAAAARPTRDYTMFLHLCQDCAVPPLAHEDAPPLNGYGDAGRTTTWQIGDPVHDERSIPLPASLPPGRYTLLLGVYPAGDPAEGARLPVAGMSAPVLGGTRLILGEVIISSP